LRGEGRLAGDGLSAVAPVLTARPSRLPALTGLRCFAALNLVFYHFSNPAWFGVFTPIVNSGYISVSFFLLLSGFILAYNYGDRGERGEVRHGVFWQARFSRLYPVYLFTLLVSFGMLQQEFALQTHGMFLAGVALTPLLLQGWHPVLATFWNTPAWTMSTEAFFYLIFPWLIAWRRPRRLGVVLALLGGLWLLGMLPGALYLLFNPDGAAHSDRYSTGMWMRALKFTPLPHLPSFLFGMMLARLNEMIPPASRSRLAIGALGFAALYGVLSFGDRIPFALMHDGLLMPLFAALILGLAGENALSRLFSFRVFVAIGEASFCLYLLHFNLWNMIHDSHLLERLGLIAYDPWISYLLLITAALLTLHLVEKPSQKWIKRRISRPRTAELPATVASPSTTTL
jgi:peptidoglycan/LPS O-acetylase OafA/YrhL